MKNIALIVLSMSLCLAFLSGCEQNVVIEPEHKLSEFQTYAIASSENVDAVTKTFMIQALESRYEPESISINEGDHVQMIIMNTADSDIMRFGVERYAAEQPIPSGTFADLTFTADEKGVFVFGDESGRTGTVVVS
jgi:hypothetical protein